MKKFTIPQIDSQNMAPEPWKKTIPQYIGCLTMPYNPSEITTWFLSLCILNIGDRNEF